MSLTFLDIIFLLIILFIAIHGVVNGFIKEFFSKVALVAGVFFAILFFAKLSPFINKHIESSFVASILSFLLIFVVVYLIIRIIQHFVGTFFQGEILGGLDRALGFFFGVAEGLLVVSLILIILYAQPWFDLQKVFEDSFFHGMLQKVLSTPTSYVKGFIAHV